jgi:hypothetical protein
MGLDGAEYPALNPGPCSCPLPPRNQQEQLEALLQGLCAAECAWTDISLPVLTAALAQQPGLSATCVLGLLERLEEAAAGGAGEASPKLAAFANSLIGRYRHEVVRHVALLRRILRGCRAGPLATALRAALPPSEGGAGQEAGGGGGGGPLR